MSLSNFCKPVPIFLFINIIALLLSFNFSADAIAKQTKENIKKSNVHLVDTWNLEFVRKIKKNWVRDPGLSELNKSLEAIVLLKIAKTGELIQILWEKESGSDLFDECVMKTINKSAPFHPLPKGITDYDICIIFSPMGLK